MLMLKHLFGTFSPPTAALMLRVDPQQPLEGFVAIVARNGPNTQK
jgi:hypothetical protein